MTYEEMLALYQQAGGGLQQPDYTSFTGSPQSQAVMLPDGRMAFSMDDGSVVVAERTPDGQYNNIQTFAPGAQSPVESQERFEPGANMRRSLAGATSILAAPLLYGAGEALLGGQTAANALPMVDDWAAAGSLLSTNPATIAAPAAGVTLEQAVAGLPSISEGMTLEQAAAQLGAPAAAAPAVAAPALGNDAQVDYSNEGRNYPTPQSTQGPGGSPVNASAPSNLSMIQDLANRLGIPLNADTMKYLAPLVGAVAAVADNKPIDINSTSSSTTNTGATTQSAQTGQTNTSSQQSLAPWLQPYAQDYVERSRALANAPSSNATMDTSRDLLTRYATDGTPLTNAATAQQMNVIDGAMLRSNSYIDGVARDIADRMGEGYATGTRAGTFSRLNNDGNSVFAKTAAGQTTQNNDRAFSDSLGATMRQLYYGDYAGERQAQDAASRNSINLSNFNVQNARGLYDVGSNDFQRPYFQNQEYGRSINPAYGSQQTGTGNTSAQTWNNTAGWQNTQGQQTMRGDAPSDFAAAVGGTMLGANLYRNLYR